MLLSQQTFDAKYHTCFLCRIMVVIAKAIHVYLKDSNDTCIKAHGLGRLSSLKQHLWNSLQNMNQVFADGPLGPSALTLGNWMLLSQSGQRRKA